MQPTKHMASMGRTTIQVSEELADELYARKQRGDSYEDVIWRLLDEEPPDTTDPSPETVTPEGAVTGAIVSLEELTFKRDLNQERANVLSDWLAHVRELGQPVSKSDFEEWWGPDATERAGYQAAGFWEMFAKPAMQQSDAFNQPDARSYRWVGE
jgi:hypothetical protein